MGKLRIEVIKNGGKMLFIEFKNVTKFFLTKSGKKKYILKNFNFKMPLDSNIGILGLNGEGKSTILRMIGGIEEVNSGEIIIPKNFSVSWPLALRGGFHNNLNAYENIKFICRIYGDNEKEISKKIKYIEDFSELKDSMNQEIKYYSSGMKSRLSFALSMSFDFDYYLIDEILSVGDRPFRNKCIIELEKKRRSSKMLIVSHDLNTIKNMSDQIIFIENKKLVLYKDIDYAILKYKNKTNRK